jgi:hypothetical protein
MNKAFYLILWGLLFSNNCLAQKYLTKTAHITLRIETVLGGIIANNHQTLCTIDFASGEVVFQALLKGFEFRRAVVEERFDSYAEADKFPKITFRGKIQGFAQVNLKKNGIYPVKVAGNLNFHDYTKNLNQSGSIEIKAGKVYAKAKFRLNIDDFKLKLSTAERRQISDFVDVNIQAVCSPLPK